MTSGASNRELAAKFSRAAGPVAPSAAGSHDVSRHEDRLSKFTVQLDRQHAEDFDAVVLAARRALGRRVDKSEVVRALIRLLVEDATLRSGVHEQLRAAKPPGCPRGEGSTVGH